MELGSMSLRNSSYRRCPLGGGQLRAPKTTAETGLTKSGKASKDEDNDAHENPVWKIC